MFKYLKEYRWADIRQIMDNDRAVQKSCAVSLKGKTAVITGATSGVGYEAARELAAHGADIVMVNRSAEKSARVAGELEQGFGVKVKTVIADLSLTREAHAAAESLLKECPKIDILVNNAGMHSTKRTLTSEGLETVFALNHLAAFILTARLINRMKETPGARIIQVNSQGHRFNGLDCGDLDWKKRHYTGLRGYGAAKTAQLLTVWEFADALKDSGVTINAMHPGAVKSAIGENNGPLYRWFKQTFLSGGLADPSISGRAIYYLAASPELTGVSGQYFNLTHPEKPAPHALDREAGRVIWNLSLELSGLKDGK